MKNKFLIVPLLIFLSLFFWSLFKVSPQEPLWGIRSIDTVKYSRDLSQEKLKDPNFVSIIDSQVEDIASINATHIAIGTPYDEEFLPILKLWVSSARSHNLKVWFRGNFSGWEGWFGYEPIDRKTHILKIEEFILKNPDLFEDGDIFSSCPECENGLEGDPRETKDTVGFREFLVEEYKVSSKSFGKLGVKVAANFNSMNFDVAKLIMDKDTTSSLGGVVVIDHYVIDPEQMSKDIDEMAVLSGGKVVIGEFGAPIPDIHGQMSDRQQAEWIKRALLKLAENRNVLGVNYWVNVGGSTQIWKENREALPAVEVIRQIYSKQVRKTI